MKPHTLATVGLRILAVYLVSQSFLYLASVATRVLGNATGLSHAPALVWAYAWVLAPLVVGLCLWLAAPQLARWATRRLRPEPLACIDEGVLAHTAYAVAGVLIFATAVPYVIMEAFRIWQAHRIADGYEAPAIAYLVAHLGQMVLGTWLALGARGLARLLHALRYAGSSGKPSWVTTRPFWSFW